MSGKVYINGRRSISAKEFKERVGTLTWYRCGTMMESEQSLSPKQVISIYNDGKGFGRRVYEDARGLVLRFKDDVNWYEGRK